MRVFASAILLLCLAGHSLAAVRVTGPATCPVGTLVELRASSDVPKAAITWLTAAAAVDYRSYELKSGDAVVLFVAKTPGPLEFACAELAVGPDGSPAFSIVKHRVEVTGEPGPVPPGPQPPQPNPPNPVPVDKWGLTAIARQTAPANVQERAAVKRNYESVASQLAAGGFQGIDAAYAKLRELNRAATGNAATEGHPWNRFAFATSERMDACEKDGTLQRTPGDFAAAWQAIARGLE